MNMHPTTKQELRVTLKKYLPLVISIFLVVVAAFLIMSSCKPKDTAPMEKTVGEDGEVITEPQRDYPGWQYTAVSARCSIDRQTAELICVRVKNDDASMLNNLLTEMGGKGWELVNTMETGDINTFIFKRPK